MKSEITALLLDWFNRNKRPLPWRTAYDPYHVWISEVMLQQTQMDRVVNYFERFILRFPDIMTLAHSHEDDVLKQWEGLGYYSRARNLQKAAQELHRNGFTTVPDDPAVLRTLPGIGDYTAGAILSIAFNRPVPAIDANVMRVFARLFDIDTPIKERPGRQRVQELVTELIPQDNARDFNQALMEFGAVICRPKTPQCDTCPLLRHCEAKRLDILTDRPVLTPSPEIIRLNVCTGVLSHNGSIYIQKRLPQGAWANLWEFPGGRIEEGETPEAAIIREFMEETSYTTQVDRKIGIIKHGYTKYHVTLHCFHLRLDHPTNASPPPPVLTAATASHWLPFDKLATFAFPAGHRKLMDILKREANVLQW
ncbi:A/G-specific adenine glycosylase [Desulfovibrio inopinatus]|uniref:A/G-specific adenine glycosylase n=1 Tax=Desulfovibrio inopinatus TaxID=102109 RepID=UPI00040A5419|nr:A/G-specific adenine glycosylase [Desulfovibrio inopinatus]